MNKLIKTHLSCSGTSASCPPKRIKVGQPCKQDNYENAVCTENGKCLGEFTGACSSDSDCDNGKTCSSYKCENKKCVYSTLSKGIYLHFVQCMFFLFYLYLHLCWYKFTGTVCRPAADKCDIEEVCDGENFSCPSDVRKDGCSVEPFSPSSIDDNEDNDKNDHLKYAIISIFISFSL